MAVTSIQPPSQSNSNSVGPSVRIPDAFGLSGDAISSTGSTWFRPVFKKPTGFSLPATLEMGLANNTDCKI